MEERDLWCCSENPDCQRAVDKQQKKGPESIKRHRAQAKE